MVARNFYEGDANPYYPLVDFGSAQGSISAMEFPLLNYLIYVFSCAFGYDHWYGRLINLLVTSCGLWFFYQLIARNFDRKLAFTSCVLLSISLWFTFGRKIMPDTMAVSLVLGALYFAFRYLNEEHHRLRYALFSALLFMLGTLAKLPAAIPLFALPLMWWTMGSVKNKITLAVFYLIAAVPVLHWYFVWTPHLTSTYGLQHFFMGKPIAEGLSELKNEWTMTIHRIVIGPFKYIGAAVFLAGLLGSIYHRQKQLLLVFGLGALALALIAAKSGATFTAHDYYILPFVPFMALMAGYFIHRFPPRWSTILLVTVSVESLLNQYHDLRWKPSYTAYEQLETFLDQYVSRNEPLAVNSAPNPTALYFSHRKGWMCTNDELLRPDFIEQLRQQGMHCVLICKTRFGSDITLDDAEVVAENSDFKLYRFSKNSASMYTLDARPAH